MGATIGASVDGDVRSWSVLVCGGGWRVGAAAAGLARCSRRGAGPITSTTLHALGVVLWVLACRMAGAGVGTRWGLGGDSGGVSTDSTRGNSAAAGTQSTDWVVAWALPPALPWMVACAAGWCLCVGGGWERGVNAVVGLQWGPGAGYQVLHLLRWQWVLCGSR